MGSYISKNSGEDYDIVLNNYEIVESIESEMILTATRKSVFLKELVLYDDIVGTTFVEWDCYNPSDIIVSKISISWVFENLNIGPAFKKVRLNTLDSGIQVPEPEIYISLLDY